MIKYVCYIISTVGSKEAPCGTKLVANVVSITTVQNSIKEANSVDYHNGEVLHDNT